MKFATEEVREMRVHVVIELSQGIVSKVRVFVSEKSAKQAEQSWLKQHSIRDSVGRECKTQDGTELLTYECPVEP